MSSRDEGRDVFSKKMVDILNYGALNLAMGIGYRLGLFEVLDASEAPLTLPAIAERSELNARYIKEWLGIMVCGGIIQLFEDGGEQMYVLPKAHGDFLTKRASSGNLGVYTQEIPLLTTCAMKAVEESFSTGDGVGYDHYPRFQSFMSELAIAKHQKVLIDQFLPTVDDGKLVARLLAGIRVCDLGCAEGTALLLMAKAFPESRFTGIDIDRETIDKARDAAMSQGLSNVELNVTDAAALQYDDSFRGRFDYITAFDAIHDQTQPLEAVKSVHHMLAEGGAFSMIDIAARTNLRDNLSHPMGAFLYTVSLMHCMPVGLVNGGVGLGMMWGREKAVELLKAGGFQDEQVLEMPHDSFNLHFFCRR